MPAPLPTPTAQTPHKLVRKALLPPRSLPRSQRPASQAPGGSAEEEGSHLLGAQPTRRQSGGAMGRAEGEGRQKGRTSFFVFFFFTSFTGRGVCGRGFPPRDHFPGTTRAQVPSPLPQLDPCPSCPQEGSNPPQSWEAGQSGNEKRACVSLRGAQASRV